MSEPRKSFRDLGKLGKKIKGKKAALEDFIPIFHALIDEIEARGLDVEGILRISGSLPEITALKKSLLKGNPGDISKMDIHIATGLLKTFLRELQEPLLLFSNYEPLLKASVMPNFQVKVKVLKTIVSNLPPVNHQILNDILQLAVHISHREETNRMNPHNIAVVLGPTILRAEKETLESMMRDSMQVVKVVEDMIDSYAELFGNKTIEIQRPVSLNPQEAEFLRKRAASLFPSSEDKTIEEWRTEVTKLKEQMREMEARFAEDTREREVLHAFQAGLEGKLAEEKEQVANLQSEVQALQEQLKSNAKAHDDALAAAKSEMERERANFEEKLAEQVTHAQSLENASKELKQQISAAKTSVAVLETKLKAAEANANDATLKVQAVETKLEATETTLKSVQKNEKTLIDANSAAKSELETLKKKQAELVAENAKLTAKLKAVPTATTPSTAPSTPTSSTTLASSNTAVMEAKIGGLETDLKQAQEKISKLEKDQTKLESELKRANDQATKYEADAKKAIEEKRTLEAELKKAQLATRTAQAQIDSLRKELSDSMDASAKELADERARSAANMKKVREDRSAAEVAMKKCQLENANLEISIKQLTTKNNSFVEEIEKLKTTQKTHNSALKKLQTERDNMESECKKLQIMRDTENKRHATDVAAAETAIQKVQAEKASIEQERQKLISERSRLLAEIEGLRSDNQSLKSDIKRLSVPPSKAPEQELQRMRLEREDLLTQLQKTKEELEKTQACVEGLEKQLNEKKDPKRPASASPSTAASSGSKASPFGGSPTQSGAKGRTVATLTEKERELAEQLFSWMTLSLKLESLLQDRQTANYDSGALLQSLLADKTPWHQWPAIIQDKMTIKSV